jgi:rSAM/selenodomain-associated transferase 2
MHHPKPKIMLSIIIPTLNEAPQIEATLAAARAVAPTAELIVADGGSTDGTPALAAEYATVITAPRGRARQMNAGAAHARGDVLLFLHADTRLPPDADDAITALLRDSRVIGGGFGLAFDEPGWLYRLIGWSTTMRSRSRQSFTGDQAIFVRAATFRSLGGYADIPLMEDIEICPRLRTAGELRVLMSSALVSARRHRKYGPLRVLITGWVYQFLYALGMPEFGLHRLYYRRPPE